MIVTYLYGHGNKMGRNKIYDSGWGGGVRVLYKGMLYPVLIVNNYW